MKRRAILAGLLAAVLAALVAVLVSTGGGGHEDEITKGQPFTGDRGVTRSVASILARQRYRDQHPEIERRRSKRLVALEAVREEAEAAREDDQASGEVPEASEESEAGEGGEALREEEGAAAEGTPAVGEASLERAREVGERAAEAANIREKPEPGGEEEGLPPKRSGPSTRQQRIGNAAITPRQAVTPSSTNFLGADSEEAGFVPPDSMGAVGPTQILVAVNGKIKAFNKNGTPGGLDVSDSAFWAPVRNGSEPTDPGVEYDRLSQRWIVSAINTEEANNRIMLAVSEGPTITSTSDFTYFFFNQAAPPPSASPRFADYPQLGVDANAIYIGVNEFAGPPATGFLGTTAYVIRKSSVLGVGPIVVTAFRNLTTGGQGPVSPQPVTDMVPTVDSGYVVGPDATLFSQLDVRRINNPGGTPSISGNLVVPVPQTFVPTSTPFSVPAQGTIGGLDALDDRLFEAMIGRDPDGNETLWTAHNLRMNALGQSNSSGNRVGARWYQLGSLDTSPSLIQSGQLVDPAPSNPRQFWIPSIAMNGQGHASINTSAAGATHQAAIASSGRLFTDALTTTEDFQITQDPGGTYNLGSGMPRRWGDYSQTVIDPSDNMSFWAFQEYASNEDEWGVRVIKLEPPPPATPSTANPGTVPQGQCAVAVDVDGTSTDGSGFFDPGPDPGGPGYDSHITASASGGVEVNDVIYADATHVTLDLDTTNATTGSVDVTITNPDGQEVSATGLLTVGSPATGPTTPCLDGTSPPSPSNDNNPKIFGRADPGSTVKLYPDSDCTVGTEVGSGDASDFNDGNVGIPLDAPVDDNSGNTYWATVTDGSSTVSECSSALQTSSAQPLAEASETYIEDSTAPDVSVTVGPGLTNDRTPSFTFSASDPAMPIPSLPITFECSIDTGTPDFGGCNGPGTTHTAPSPLSDGSYTFRVRATDAAGNTSAEATRAFQVDATPPTVRIDSGPSGVIADQSPTFTFSGSDTAGAVTFQCSIGTSTPAFRVCSGPGNSDTPASPLADASYTFWARAIDAASNFSVATRSFSVQTPKPAPETTITKGPKKTRKARPKFKFTSSDPAATFQCKLDKGQFAACASPFRTPKLRSGKHRLKVRAVGAGGTDGTPAVRKFRILPPS